MSKNTSINVETLLPQIVKMPVVRVNREEFLTKELKVYYPKELFSDAVIHSPAYAGIPLSFIDKTAKHIINYETNKVSALSFAAGLPGGLAMLGTVSADITQYFVFMLRVLQKLAYLYSYPDFELKEEKLSDETLNSLIVFIGVMVGAQGANAAVGILTKTITDKVVKAIPRKALTKTTVWYPLVKKVAKAIGIKMTKPVLAKSASKVIPVLGGVASGGISYVSFKLSANRLKKKLREMPLCDPESELYSRHKKNSSEDE